VAQKVSGIEHLYFTRQRSDAVKVWWDI